ncbi:putative addiction module antidote protein [Bartonella henselae]|uniref:addiction module antidote protein n=1 Tax=Bartonella henselae TaxID=38323 RepID=UPI00095997A0|nr:addiction module antidote protein [Bartonella henselae]OLL54730.1 transcriptional regulator [Bartonella henselae]OLL55424.1 transcriptional regulator [Bartonella henselae]UJM33083.1 putative addiction module antidote protein [Bartonella henselae]
MKATLFKPEEYLETPEEQQMFLNEAFKTGDAAHIADAIGIVARAQNMSALARTTDRERSGLYRSLSKDGNPKLSTLVAVLSALNLQLNVQSSIS